MFYAKIYQKSKNAMQSGLAHLKNWRLEIIPYDNNKKKFVDPLMGWTGIKNTLYQVKLDFETLEQAKAFAIEKGLDYSIIHKPEERRLNARPPYSHNFSFTRRL